MEDEIKGKDREPAIKENSGDITRLLGELHGAAPEEQRRTLNRLIPLVYDNLRFLARSQRYRWPGIAGHGTTSLVHEAYARFVRGGGGEFENRRQFFRTASMTMRSILIDNARWHQRQKRGGGVQPVSIDEERLVSDDRCEELLILNESLDALEAHDAELVRVVECRCFGGLTISETGEALGLSPATVKRRWTLAQAWLYRSLSPSNGISGPP